MSSFLSILKSLPTIVYVTCPSISSANQLAKSIIGKKLAACVNVIPSIHSHYFWEGKSNCDDEILIILKTRGTLFSELEKFIQDNHKYDTPEIIATPIIQGSPKYIQWINDNTKEPTIPEKNSKQESN